MTKMTKKNFFEALINFANGGSMAYAGDEGDIIVSNDAIIEFATHEIELLDKKAAKAKDSAEKKKAAGDELSATIEAILTDELQTISEITEQIEDPEVTNAKVQYRLNALAKAGKAEKGEVVVEGGEGKKNRKVVAYKIVG